MIPVVIDSTAFVGENHRRKSGPFLSLAALCQAGCVALYVPDIVRREFEERLVDENAADLQKATRAFARRMEAFGGAHAPDATGLRAKLAEVSDEGEAWVRAELMGWLEALNAKVLKVVPAHMEPVLDGYFAGVPPYKIKKDRTSIPDAFILEAIRDLKVKHPNLQVVTNDNVMVEACRALGLTVPRHLEEFVKTVDCPGVTRPYYLVEALELEQTTLWQLAYSTLSGELIDHAVTTSHLPEDCEPVIAHVRDFAELELDWGNAEELPGGVAEIPFTVVFDVVLFYHIYKADFYALSEEHQIRSDASEYGNRHYYEVLEDSAVTVRGRLSVQVGPDESEDGYRNVRQRLNHETVNVGEIEEVAVEVEL